MLDTKPPLKTPPIPWDYLDDLNASDGADEFLLHYSSELIQKYGDIITLPGVYLITSPNAFKHILKTHAEQYSKNNQIYHRLKSVFGESLIVTEGPVWKNHRQILHKAFTHQNFAHYASVMVSRTQQLIQGWKTQGASRINLVPEMKHLTLEIAFKVFCNYKLSIRDSLMLRGSTLTALQTLRNPSPISPWFPSSSNMHFFWSMRKLNNLLKSVIKHRQANPGSTDLLSLLLAEPSLSEQNILDELKTMILTGHETTACALSWSLHLLEKHPEYRLLMEAEVDQVLGNHSPTIDDCNALPMVKAIFLETLRLYPSIWCLSRTATQADNIDGYDVPENTKCVLNIYGLHRNPNYWDNPNDFYPPRFLGDAPTERHPYAFLPFSIGPHSCIGTHFALTEGILLLAIFAQQLRFKALYDTDHVIPTPYLSLQPPAFPMEILARSKA